MTGMAFLRFATATGRRVGMLGAIESGRGGTLLIVVNGATEKTFKMPCRTCRLDADGWRAWVFGRKSGWCQVVESAMCFKKCFLQMGQTSVFQVGVGFSSRNGHCLVSILPSPLLINQNPYEPPSL